MSELSGWTIGTASMRRAFVGPSTTLEIGLPAAVVRAGVDRVALNSESDSFVALDWYWIVISKLAVKLPSIPDPDGGSWDPGMTNLGSAG